jgi:2',3'-cyclic-nucleotide 2'-phosphodiesterase / 3'-nucleotidase
MKKVTVTILETSDLHGNIFPIHYATNEAAEVGLGKVATIIKREREKNKHTIVIDNGDMIQGTPLMYHYFKFQAELANPMIIVANECHYDAAVIGNHEFNYGQELLQEAISQSTFPWLAANIVDEDGNPYFGTPYIIRQVTQDLKVAVLGLTTKHIPYWEQPEHIEGIVFEDVVTCAKKWVNYLKTEENADIVLVSYHGGFECDIESGEPIESLTGENQGYELCMEVEGIDVLLTGHQHRQLVGKEVNGVSVIQPGYNGSAVGKISLTLEKKDTKWECVEKKGELISVADVEVDRALVKKVNGYEEAAQRWLDTSIGRVEGSMEIHNPLEARLQDHPFIEFINRVQMEIMDVDISCTALLHNEPLGLKEEITMRDILANYPYPNTLTVIRISGQEMKEALEHTASYFETYDGKQVRVHSSFLQPKPQHYNYDMWEGIEYEINICKPIGERITKLEYRGEPIDLQASYDVVMNNYRASGGGEYNMFRDKLVVKEHSIDVSELLATYIATRKVIEATVNHNWHVRRSL